MQTRSSRVAAIHDLSGFGRCSLAVILPTLSTMGVQVCAVPTAILSTHTGGLGNVVMRDLTDYIQPALAHYQELGLDFACIYSGFLNSEDQIDHCLKFFKSYPNAYWVVDPVMGDHGKPYRTCTPGMRRRMKELVREAGVITPNLTEAAMLLDIDYPFGGLSASQTKSMLARLGEMGPGSVVITGVSLANGALSNVGYDREKNGFWRVDSAYVPVSYPGTGDIFASVLTGGLLTGDSLPIAMDRATKFLELAIKTTYSYGTDTRWGVMLESCLGWLTQHNVLKDYRPL